jgi:SAM-dependent methyltransferase
VHPDPVEKLSLAMLLLMSMRMLWLRRDLPQLRNRHIRIADVGCGDGQFIEFLKGRGYKHICGIEPDEARAQNARLRGVPVFATRQDYEKADTFEVGVDVMFVWQVLEHIDRPIDFIRSYVQWLAPSGTMVISVPNQASLQTRLFGYFSSYPDYGRHIWYHKKDYCEWLSLSSQGFVVTPLRDRNYEYEIFSWIDSMASAMTRQQNFVHKAVKKGEGSMTRRVFALALALCIFPVALVLAPISLFLGYGSTLTFALRVK